MKKKKLIEKKYAYGITITCVSKTKPMISCYGQNYRTPQFSALLQLAILNFCFH